MIQSRVKQFNADFPVKLETEINIWLRGMQSENTTFSVRSIQYSFDQDRPSAFIHFETYDIDKEKP